MKQTEQSDRIVLHAIEAMNQLMPESDILAASLEVVISGPQSPFDSMGFLNLVLALEEGVENETGRMINIAEEIQEAARSGVSLMTAADLSGFVATLMSDKLPAA